jgi:PAS domain S-box-containing protein
MVSLRSLLIIPFVLQTTLTVGLVGYWSYRSGQQAVEDLAQQLMDEVGDRIDQNLHHYLHIPEEVTQQNAASVRLGILDWRDGDRLRQYFWQQMDIYNVASVGIVTQEGDFLVVQAEEDGSRIIRQSNAATAYALENHQADAQGTPGALLSRIPNFDPTQDPPADPYFGETRTANRSTWRVKPALVQDQAPVLFAVNFFPFYDPTGSFQGIMSSSVSLTQLGTFLEDLTLGQHGQAFVFERNGTLLGTSSGELLFQLDTPTLEDSWPAAAAPIPARLHLLDSQDRVTQAVAQHLLNQFGSFDRIPPAYTAPLQIDRQTYFIQVEAFQFHGKLEWLRVVVIPEADFIGHIQRNVQRTIALCALALIGAIALSLWIARRVTQPLAALNQAAQAIAAGTWNPTLDPIPVREVESLRQSLQRMAQDLHCADQLRRNYAQDLERLAAEKTTALQEAQRIAHVGSWDYDLGSQTVTWSEELYRIYDADPSRPVPRPDLTIHRVPPEEDDRYAAYVRDAAIARQPFEIDLRIITQTGQTRYVYAKGQPIYDDAGQVIRLSGTVADITERKQVELALQASEERFQEIANTISQMFFVRTVNPDRYIYISPAYETIWGRSRQSLIDNPRSWMDAVHPDDRDWVLSSLRQQFEGNNTRREYRIIRADGAVRWISASISVIRDDQGHPLRFIGLAEDVSDRKQAEELLRRSEARYLSILQDQTELIKRMRPDGTLTFVNDALCRYYGISPDTTLARGYGNRIYEEDRDRVDASIANLSVEQPVGTVEHRVWVNGTVRWMQWTNRAIYDDQGTLIEIQAVGRDIHDRKQAELALQESEKRFQTLVTNLPGMVYRYVPDDDGMGRFTYVSSGAEDLYGVSIAQIYEDARHILDLTHPEDMESLQQSIATAVANGAPWAWEGRLTTPAGQLKWIQGRSRPYATPEGMVWDGILMDISDRKRAELALDEARQAAEAANQAKSTFIANISHELRSPLNAILGFARLLQKSRSLTPDDVQRAQIIERSGHHLLSIINQVLDLAQLESNRVTLRIHRLDLWRLLDDLHNLFLLRTTEKGLIFTLTRSPAVPRWIETDEMKLRQILINLLDNAVKFTQVGEITLALDLTPATPDEPGQHLRIQVIDTGCGISPADQAQLFQAFSQGTAGRESRQGTGLGLTISQEFVHLLGGSLSLSSQVNQGSCFYIYLPLNTPVSARPSGDSRLPIGLQPDQPRYRILVVDDNPINRDLLIQTLQRLSLEVQEADNGLVALERWQDWQPHLVFMDLRMPGLDGYDTTRRLREAEARQHRIPKTVIIGISATGIEHHYTLAREAGCDDFLPKPFEETDLFDALQQHLHLSYRYADPVPSDPPSPPPSSRQSLVTALDDLDGAIAQALEEALILGDATEIHHVIRTLAIAHPNLAKTLDQMVEQVMYDTILAALRQSRCQEPRKR